MDDLRSGTEMKNEAIDLFSVDADAHLQKLAACAFPSPAQLPVELVRDSLRRGARDIVVEVQRNRLLLEDEGAGVAEDIWRELACAVDPGRGVAEREKAIDALQRASSPGIGLLAAFVPGATRIRIENSASRGGAAMVIAEGQVRHADAADGAYGTRITIARRGGPAELEKQLLRELCAAVPAAITLNGRRIESKPLLRRALVRRQVDMERGQAQVSAPAAGDICRVWLLDQWIPWQVFACPSRHGLVFEAALESGSAPSEAEWERLDHEAARLYQWLAGNYHSFPEKHQARIEELLFRKVGYSGDLRLLSAFAPFRLWRSRQRLTLEEVRRKAERSVLYALPLGCDPEHVLGHHQEALLLSPLQKDFLLNRLGLPLVEPAASMGAPGGRWSWISSGWRRIARAADLLPRRSFHALTPEQLSDAEGSLCRELEIFWLRLRPHGPAAPPPNPLQVVMVKGRGLAPAVWRSGTHKNVLYLRRRHPLVGLAVQRVARDPACAELAFAALAPARLLTAAGH